MTLVQKLIQTVQIVDPNEREKVLEKREKNRVAAEKARYKKKERMNEKSLARCPPDA